MLHQVYVCATGQSDETPAKSAESDPMSAAPTGLSGNARLVMDSLAADADMPQASSLATHRNGASPRCAAMRLQISSSVEIIKSAASCLGRSKTCSAAECMISLASHTSH